MASRFAKRLAVAWLVVAVVSGWMLSCGAKDAPEAGAPAADGSIADAMGSEVAEPIADGRDGGSEAAPCSQTDVDAVGLAACAITPAQAWCSATAVNPPTCPRPMPAPGAPCSTPDVRCGYGVGSGGFALDTCHNGLWSEVAHTCEHCDVFDAAATPIGDAQPCGALPDIGCDDNPDLTDQERADLSLSRTAGSCGLLSENAVIVQLSGGCATALAFLRDGLGVSSYGQCLSALLSGRRIACATSVPCVAFGHSTVAH